MNHLIAFLAGFILDLILGDPLWLPHPVRFIGKIISDLENEFLGKRGTVDGEDKFARLSGFQKRFFGVLEVVLVCLVTEVFVVGILMAAYKVHSVAGIALESIMNYQLLATKCLKVESMKVYRALEKGTLEDARKAVSMIVGRDTKNLTDAEITKAAVETVAENTSDGVMAPMFFIALGGPVFGFFYKCINTMDSMIGYKNQRYIDFGMCAAKTDDAVNFIPSRLCALLMIVSCGLLGREYSAAGAFRIWKRDRYKHESPNSAQTESVCAGALNVRLAGPAVYEGKTENKPFLGDDGRPVEHKDIIRANRLLYATAVLGQIIFVGCMLVIQGVVNARW